MGEKFKLRWLALSNIAAVHDSTENKDDVEPSKDLCEARALFWSMELPPAAVETWDSKLRVEFDTYILAIDLLQLGQRWKVVMGDGGGKLHYSLALRILEAVWWISIGQLDIEFFEQDQKWLQMKVTR